MRRLLLAVLLLAIPLTYHVTMAAQTDGAAPADVPTGTAEAGKAVWATGNTSCRNCHGADAEGSFGVPLAGRKLTFERVRSYVRNPIGRMPAYIPSELSDQEIADLTAYWDSLPSTKPSPWREPRPGSDAPKGQQIAIATIGCAQCHGGTLDTPRHGAAEVTGDWEWFKHMVYEHTTAQREQWAMLDRSLPRVTPAPAGPPGRNRVRMGNYNRKQLPEATLREIFDWINDLGYLPTLTGQITPGTAGASGATYTVNLANSAVKDKGVTAEGVTVEVVLPAGATVVSATGTGYQGVKAEESKGNVAVWNLPRLAPADRETLTITLSSAVDTLKGTIRWAKPAVKADGEVDFQLATGRRGRGAA